MNRIASHPILRAGTDGEVRFTFEGRELTARPGEVITSALYAHGIDSFGYHHADGSPQGIYCANGQCSQCLVVADGVAVKGCMTPVREGMAVEPCRGLPPLPSRPEAPPLADTRTIDVDVLVVGGGPAGISAAVELGRLGVDVLVVDDKDRLGGKLVLQTHSFFGSIRDCSAGTRGIDIAADLARQVQALPSVRVWLGSTAVGVFVDKLVGVMRGHEYVLVRPRILLVASGAREKALAFPGCDLPGVYGAGAFQTLVNRDLIRPTSRLFIVGGGNVGLIAGYHAIQAGIAVCGLVEALPQVGGYKVHLDKLKRLGVEVMTSHTVVRAHGKARVEGVTIARVSPDFSVIPGTHRDFAVDTLLIAVGLSPVNELLIKAKEYGMEAYAAGDAQEIAEASAAIFGGRIRGRKIAQSLGHALDVPGDWEELVEVLKSKPGRTGDLEPQAALTLPHPVIRCVQRIPCNPCTELCPRRSISIPEGSITGLPEFRGECMACGRCVAICPGLAITVVLPHPDPDLGLVMLPYEMEEGGLDLEGEVVTMGMEGGEVGRGRVVAVRNTPFQDRCRLVLVEVPKGEVYQVAGFRVQQATEAIEAPEPGEEDPIICRCERVRKSQIVAEIRAGVRDINALKANLRATMGACNGKTCTELIGRIFREEGVPLTEVKGPTMRPFLTEVPLSVFAGCDEDH